MFYSMTLNTFYLRIYSIKHIIKIARDETCCHHHMGYSFRLAARDLLDIYIFMAGGAPHHPKTYFYEGQTYLIKGPQILLAQGPLND